MTPNLSSSSDASTQAVPLIAGGEDLAVIRRKIEALTEELFGQAPTVTEESDPEIDSEYFVFAVVTDAEASEFVRLNHLWHGRMLQIAGPWANLFRLGLEIR